MKFYFSGVNSKEDLAMLEEAKVSHLLVDPVDYVLLGKNVPDGPDDYWEPSLAVDSGAYRAWKNGGSVTPGDIEYFYRHYLEGRYSEVDFLVSPDVIGDSDASMANYNDLNTRGVRSMPVWHWGTPKEVLEYYLRYERTVGIGALVEWMRGKNESVLRDLKDLCFQYPQRFHLFGLAWPKAIEVLAPYAYSADSSVWLRGARYGLAIFKHKGHGHLTQAPAKFIPEYAGLDRFERCVLNAKNIEEFCNA